MRGLVSGLDTSLHVTLAGDGLADYPEGVALEVLAGGPVSEWFFTDSTTGDGWPILQLEGTAPTAATIGTGWDVTGVAATQYARMAYGVVRTPATFGGTAQPSGGPDNTLKDSWRSDTTLSGTIAAGDTTFRLPLVAVSGNGADVRVRFRLWRSSNADGSTPTEITSGTAVGSTLTALSGTQQVSSVTVTLGEITLTGEYLFAQVALETV